MAIASLLASAAQAGKGPIPPTLSIDEPSLATALSQLGRQAEIDLIFNPALTQGLVAPRVKGPSPPRSL